MVLDLSLWVLLRRDAGCQVLLCHDWELFKDRYGAPFSNIGRSDLKTSSYTPESSVAPPIFVGSGVMGI